MERGWPSFFQETVVAGDPVELQVKVQKSSWYVRLEIEGGSVMRERKWNM